MPRMKRKRAKGGVYSKLTKQDKFLLLKLYISEHKSINQTAQILGITYSTAKTIIFFYKNKYKNYDRYYVEDGNREEERTKMKQASWKYISDTSAYKKTTKIQIIVNNKLVENYAEINNGLAQKGIGFKGQCGGNIGLKRVQCKNKSRTKRKYQIMYQQSGQSIIDSSSDYKDQFQWKEQDQ